MEKNTDSGQTGEEDVGVEKRQLWAVRGGSGGVKWDHFVRKMVEQTNDVLVDGYKHIGMLYWTWIQNVASPTKKKIRKFSGGAIWVPLLIL